MNNIMLDLETLSTEPDAMIVSIGAVQFDKDGLGPSFYAEIDIEHDDQRKAHISTGSIKFWMKQPDTARAVFESDLAKSMFNSLFEFNEFVELIKHDSDVVIWGNGADFDNVILSRAYHRHAIPRPWGQYSNRCYRTLKKLAPHIKLERSGTHHNALDDAISQAEHAVLILNQMGGWEA